MTKKETRKKAQELILKDGLSHQEAFDSLRNDSDFELEALATEIAKIPSPGRMALTANLRYTLMVLLGLNVLLRALTIAAYGAMFEFHPAVIIPLIILGIFVPALGIWGAAKGTNQILTSAGLLMILAVVRGLKDTDFSDPIALALMGLVAITIGLCFYLAFKLKTPFRKTTREITEEGKVRTQVHYEFETTVPASTELLDN